MIRMKKTFILLLGMTLLTMPLMSASSYAEEDSSLIAEGKIKDSRLFVPLRAVSEKLGAAVVWDPKSKAITIQKDTSEIVLEINSKKVLLNQAEVLIDVPAFSVNGLSYVPLRFVSQVMGAAVDWNQASQTATISIDGKQIKVSPEKPAPQVRKKISEERLEDLIQKVNEATTLASVNNVNTYFSPYFTDKMLKSLTSNNGLEYNVKIVIPVRIGNVAYQDEKTAIYLESSDGDLHSEYTEPGKVLNRKATFVFDGKEWKIDSVSFYVTNRQQA